MQLWEVALGVLAQALMVDFPAAVVVVAASSSRGPGSPVVPVQAPKVW